MQLIRLHACTSTLNTLPPLAMTIGNFDGVHLGHQALIAQLKQTAQQQQLKSAIMLFEPQPLEYFLGQNAPPRITSLREKITYLKDLAIDYIILVKFDDAFRQLSATQFAQRLQQLNVRSLILGDDFHFGKDRQGNSQFLRDAGFHVLDLPTVKLSNERVSSTRIRQVLADGNFALVSKLLGRPYKILGRVVHGDKIGRTLDFPTANIALKRLKPCLHGIYAVDVKLLNGSFTQLLTQQPSEKQGLQGTQANTLFGAAHVGTRPAIKQNQLEWRLEVHFPQFSADVYGKLMEVTFLHYLHGEKNYVSLDELKQGIQQDIIDLCKWRENTIKSQ